MMSVKNCNFPFALILSLYSFQQQKPPRFSWALVYPTRDIFRILYRKEQLCVLPGHFLKEVVQVQLSLSPPLAQKVNMADLHFHLEVKEMMKWWIRMFSYQGLALGLGGQRTRQTKSVLGDLLELSSLSNLGPPACFCPVV